MPDTNREIRLAARPQAEPGPEHFELAQAPMPEPGAGEVLVRNLWMSVDPYMRGRMWDRPSYVPPFQVGHALEGGAVGEVVAGDGLPAGTLVVHNLGWRNYAALPANQAMPIDTGPRPRPGLPRRARHARAHRVRRAVRHRRPA